MIATPKKIRLSIRAPTELTSKAEQTRAIEKSHQTNQTNQQINQPQNNQKQQQQ